MVKEIILTACIVTLIFCVIAIAKNINTFNCHDKIGKAIKKYKIVCIQNHDWEALHFVEYKDMEYYMKTLWRLWDWGYTRILPKDKFEIIKPYIKYGVINEKEYFIYKDPKTDTDNLKKSHKGCCRVYRKGNELKCKDGFYGMVNEKDTLLRTVYKDGKLIIDEDFETIRQRVNGGK